MYFLVLHRFIHHYALHFVHFSSVRDNVIVVECVVPRAGQTHLITHNVVISLFTLEGVVGHLLVRGQMIVLTQQAFSADHVLFVH